MNPLSYETASLHLPGEPIFVGCSLSGVTKKGRCDLSIIRLLTPPNILPGDELPSYKPRLPRYNTLTKMDDAELEQVRDPRVPSPERHILTNLQRRSEKLASSSSSRRAGQATSPEAEAGKAARPKPRESESANDTAMRALLLS